jgi:hypothetical protein
MPRRPNPDSEANIRRIDTRARAKKQTHGFQVHFLRGATAVTKMFSDTLYGGKEAARRAARKFKEMAMRGLPQRNAARLKLTTRRKTTTRARRRSVTMRRR